MIDRSGQRIGWLASWRPLYFHRATAAPWRLGDAWVDCRAEASGRSVISSAFSLTAHLDSLAFCELRGYLNSSAVRWKTSLMSQTVALLSECLSAVGSKVPTTNLWTFGNSWIGRSLLLIGYLLKCSANS